MFIEEEGWGGEEGGIGGGGVCLLRTTGLYSVSDLLVSSKYFVSMRSLLLQGEAFCKIAIPTKAPSAESYYI